MTACWTFINKRHIPFCRNLMCFETEPYPEPCQTSKMKLFANIFNGYERLIIFAKKAILDV